MGRFIGVLEQSNTSLGRQTSCLCLPNATIHCLGRQREFIRQLSHTCFWNLQSPLCFIVITMCLVASGGPFVPLFKSYNSCFVIFCRCLLAVEVSVAHRSIVRRNVESTKMRHDTQLMRQLEQTGPLKPQRPYGTQGYTEWGFVFWFKRATDRCGPRRVFLLFSHHFSTR